MAGKSVLFFYYDGKLCAEPSDSDATLYNVNELMIEDCEIGEKSACAVPVALVATDYHLVKTTAMRAMLEKCPFIYGGDLHYPTYDSYKRDGNIKLDENSAGQLMVTGLCGIENDSEEQYEDVRADSNVLMIDVNLIRQELKQMATSKIVKNQNANTLTAAPELVADDLFNTNDFFRMVDRCVYDFRTGGIGVKNQDGKGFSTVELSANGVPKMKKCEIGQFGHKVPAVALRRKISEIKPGDMVIVKDSPESEKWLYYTGHQKTEESFEITGHEVETGTKISILVPEGLILDGESILCVKNYLGDKKAMKEILPFILLSGNGGDQNKNLALMMMMSGGEMDMESMLPLLMLQNGGNGDNNALLMMMMLGKGKLGGNMESMLPLLLLSGGKQVDPTMLIVLMEMMNKEKEKATA